VVIQRDVEGALIGVHGRRLNHGNPYHVWVLAYVTVTTALTVTAETPLILQLISSYLLLNN